MAAFRLVPNGKKIMQLANVENAHQLALKSKVSYPTVDKYINKGHETINIHCGVLASIMLDGCELSAEQLCNLRIGDVFRVIELKHTTPDMVSISDVDCNSTDE
jgi:ribosomal protein S4E